MTVRRARVCRGIMEKGREARKIYGGGKIRVSPRARKPSSADFSWQDKPRPVYSGLPWRTKMLVKPFSGGVSRERPQSRISPGGTSVCTLTRCTHGNTRTGDNESASGTDRSLTTLISHRLYIKYIACLHADVKGNLTKRFQIARVLFFFFFLLSTNEPITYI